MNRFYLPSERIGLNFILPLSGQLNHIKRVLRLKEGDKFIIFNEKGKEYTVEIVAFSKNKIIINVIEEKDISSEPSKFITLCQAIPKGKKMDIIVKITTELGVKKIVPFISKRTVPKISESSMRIKRWNRIAVSAAEVSGRCTPPDISNIERIEGLKNFISQNEISLLFSEKTSTSVKDILKKRDKNIKNILYIIGPEGALTEEEEDFLKLSGAIPVSLGRRILRVETAAIVALAIILYELE